MLKSGLVLICLFAGVTHAASKPSVDFQKLGVVCESNWDKYKEEIENIRRGARDWVGSLNTRQVATLYDADDTLVLFITNFFPHELDGRYDGVESFDDCNALNVGLQREMSDRSRSHSADVDVYKTCLMARYSNGTQLIKPLDRIVTCYERQAAQFKP